MKAKICCRSASRGAHSFYLISNDGEFFLFSQDYRKGVHAYFSKGVLLEDAKDFSKSNRDSAVIRTMNKLSIYIRYVEREYGIIVLEQTKKKSEVHRSRFCHTAQGGE